MIFFSFYFRSVLGISIQYEHSGKIFSRLIGTKRLLASHTGAYIAKTMADSIEKINVSIDNVYAIAMDNGSNMGKAGQVVKLYQSHLLDDFLTNRTFTFHQQANAYNLFIDRELKKHVTELKSEKYANIVHCGAHTLELCLKDALKKSPTEIQVIDESREMVKYMRTENVKNLLVTRKLPQAIIDVETRWSSRYHMLESLLRLREFCDEMKLVDGNFGATAEFWNNVEAVKKPLKYVADAMAKLQSSTLTLSDMFGIFTLLSHQLENYYKASSNELAFELVQAIKDRQPAVLETNSMFACMFLDPRFQCMLGTEQKSRAKKHLIELYHRINKNKSTTSSAVCINENSVSALELSSMSFNESGMLDESIDVGLEDILQQKCQSMPNLSTSNTNIETLLQEFDFSGNKRMKCSENVWNYWRNNIDNRPELFKLAAVLFAVPPTEVGTERNFSTLNFVLNKYRNGLSDQSIERIMFMKCNKDLLLDM